MRNPIANVSTVTIGFPLRRWMRMTLKDVRIVLMCEEETKRSKLVEAVVILALPLFIIALAILNVMNVT